MLDAHAIPYEEGGHTRAGVLIANLPEEATNDTLECIKSPGIPDSAPLVQRIRERGIAVISEIEFAGRFTRAKMICITGSNGKTTTTMLTYHILKQAITKIGRASCRERV